MAENLRRLRQERGLSYAELARRLAGLGHPILDTGLLKIEKGDRRIDVDDLVALAVALDVTPNKLLLPEVDITSVKHEYMLTPQVTGTPAELWSWATGEIPLGHAPASAENDKYERAAEAVFLRNERPQHWDPLTSRLPAPVEPRPAGPSFGTALRYVMFMGLKSGMDTAHIRMLVETSLAVGLLADTANLDERIAKYGDELFTRLAGQEPQAGDDAQEAD